MRLPKIRGLGESPLGSVFTFHFSSSLVYSTLGNSRTDLVAVAVKIRMSL
jgi:hypothetical protein